MPFQPKVTPCCLLPMTSGHGDVNIHCHVKCNPKAKRVSAHHIHDSTKATTSLGRQELHFSHYDHDLLP